MADVRIGTMFHVKQIHSPDPMPDIPSPAIPVIIHAR